MFPAYLKLILLPLPCTKFGLRNGQIALIESFFFNPFMSVLNGKLLTASIFSMMNSCLEEGAEEYIVKPVKLSDVKRLKDHIMRGEPQENGKSGLLKRKLIDDIQAPSVPLSFSSSVACDLESSQLPSSLSSPNCAFKRPKLL